MTATVVSSLQPVRPLTRPHAGPCRPCCSRRSVGSRSCLPAGWFEKRSDEHGVVGVSEDAAADPGSGVANVSRAKKEEGQPSSANQISNVADTNHAVLVGSPLEPASRQTRPGSNRAPTANIGQHGAGVRPGQRTHRLERGDHGGGHRLAWPSVRWRSPRGSTSWRRVRGVGCGRDARPLVLWDSCGRPRERARRLRPAWVCVVTVRRTAVPCTVPSLCPCAAGSTVHCPQTSVGPRRPASNPRPCLVEIEPWPVNVRNSSRRRLASTGAAASSMTVDSSSTMNVP